MVQTLNPELIVVEFLDHIVPSMVRNPGPQCSFYSAHPDHIVHFMVQNLKSWRHGGSMVQNAKCKIQKKLGWCGASAASSQALARLYECE